MRVPIVAGSLVDLTVELAPRRLARRRWPTPSAPPSAATLAGILGTTDEELVSSDFIGDPRSAVVDLPLLLQRVGDRLLRVVAWYDNEWGYANRLAELLARLARRALDAPIESAARDSARGARMTRLLTLEDLDLDRLRGRRRCWCGSTSTCR